MKKATKRKIILSGILFHMILVFTACGLCNKATFIGDEISDTDFYDIAFEQMNSTHFHNIDMDAGESIKVKIISKSGKISVQIYNEDDQLVYKGDDVTDIKIVSDQLQKSKQRLNRILAENTGKTIEEICRDTERDNFMTATEALQYGLIDQVIEKR